MRIAGLIGGIGPESTLEYYRLIVELYRERSRGGYPRIFVNSIDLATMLELMQADRLKDVADYLVAEIGTLARAGATFAAIAANTPHVVFPAVRERSPLPLVSIVEATCDEAKRRGMRRVGLFGTRYTMAGRFYPDVFTQAGIELVVPGADDQSYIHDKYVRELLVGSFLAETRAGLLAILERLKGEREIEGLILGGTELPLILRDEKEAGIPLLDTTRIHAQAIVERLLG